jgi:hypothetical protein
MLLRDIDNALFSPEVSKTLLASVGVSTDDAASLTASGFFAVEQGGLSIGLEAMLVNAEPVDLFHNSADLGAYRRRPERFGADIVLIDRYTGAMFRPAELTPVAAFGLNGEGPDLSYLGLDPFAIGRSRFRQFPYFTATTRYELEGICARLAQYESKDGKRILFRGQTRDHPLPRQSKVREFLYGTSPVREPSILSNAFRSKFDYAVAEPYMRLVLRDILYRRAKKQNRKHWVEDRFEELNLLRLGAELVEALVEVMGISQHYGVPTYGTDVTSSWETAFWFATHIFGRSGAYVTYSDHEWGGQPTSDWPVVYVLSTGAAHDLQLLRFPSVRAKAQNAYFLGGSWGLHGNGPANAVICAILLSPEVGVDYHETTELFPMPSSDPMYRELIEAKRRHGLNVDFPIIGLDQIFELAY